MDKQASNPDRSKNLLDDWANSVTVESLFSTYVLLDIFFSDEFINKAKSLHARMANRHAREGLRQGYKLLLVAALDNYIDEIIRSPELIGIEPDLDYRDYWAFTKGRGREITKAIPRASHPISRFVAKAISFINEILTLETWESVRTFGEKTKSFRTCLRQVFEKAYVASKGGTKVAMRDALLECSNMILWSSYDNPLPIAHMYTDYFVSSKDRKATLHSLGEMVLDEMLEESHPSSGMTRLDFSSIDPKFFPRPLPAHWALGYAFSLHESLKLLALNEDQKKHLISLDERVLNTKNWSDIDKYGRRMTTVYGLPKIFSGYSYSAHLEITDNDRQPLMAEIEELPSPERLLAVFGNRARIVERGVSSAYGSFACLLDGAIKRSKRTKEPAKVAIIVHKDRYRWNEEDYSIAIFMPAYGGELISINASIWWVFYSIGNNHSGTASANMRQVLGKLKRNKKSLDLIVIEADKEEFYRYCEDPGYLRLSDAIIVTNEITSEVRGVFPELLLSNMLTNIGYTKVRNRIRPKILKSVKGELDTVGVELTGGSLSNITILESKGQANDENELQLEINRFSDNIDIVQKNLESFCRELKVACSNNVVVEAIFVSMDTLDRVRVNIPGNIKLWDFEDFVSRLRKSHVHRDYLKLLKRIPVAIILDPFPTRMPTPGTLASPDRASAKPKQNS